MHRQAFPVFGVQLPQVQALEQTRLPQGSLFVHADVAPGVQTACTPAQLDQSPKLPHWQVTGSHLRERVCVPVEQHASWTVSIMFGVQGLVTPAGQLAVAPPWPPAPP